MTPVTPSSEVLEKIQALRYSVNGDCYNGKEWELETIDAIRAALAERTQQEALTTVLSRQPAYATAIAYLRANQAAAPASRAAGGEPDAWMWQHPENGRVGFIEHASKEDLDQWERMNKPRRIIAPMYRGVAPAAAVEPIIKYVPINTKEYREHPNDKEVSSPECEQALDDRGDSEGQGLDPFWKWAFRQGWAARGAGGKAMPAGYFLRDEQTGYLRQVQGYMSDYPGVIALYAAAPAAAVAPDDFECCGNPVVGAQYMGQSEMVCCGNPEPKGAPAAAVEPIFYNSEHRTAMNRTAAAPEGLTVNSKQAESIARQYCGGLDTRWSFSDFGLRLMLQQCADWASRRPATPDAKTAEPDMRAVCEALGFDPTNHHNAAKCPYCRPATPDAMYQIRVEGSNTAWHDAGEGAYHVTTEKNRRIVYSHPAKTAEARKPMTPEQIENLRGEANRGFNIERDDYFKAFRDAESAHGIGDQP